MRRSDRPQPGLPPGLLQGHGLPARPEENQRRTSGFCLSVRLSDGRTGGSFELITVAYGRPSCSIITVEVLGSIPPDIGGFFQ